MIGNMLTDRQLSKLACDLAARSRGYSNRFVLVFKHHAWRTPAFRIFLIDILRVVFEHELSSLSAL